MGAIIIISDFAPNFEIKVKVLKQYLLSPCCIKCGSFFCDDSLFCEFCFRIEILDKVNLESDSHLKNYQHYYFLNWRKNESDVLSQMIYRLKADNSKAAWAFYAKFFYKVLKLKIDFTQYDAIIPIPGSQKNSVHAKLFAKELSVLCGLPVNDILLKKTEALAQKTLSAEQRRRVTSIQRVEAVLIENITKYIFVDDILTTGESFLQSNRALNENPENIILSLFYRPKSEFDLTGYS